MRRFLVLLSLVLSMAIVISAQQRPAVAVSAPPVLMHPMPVSLTAAGHVASTHVPAQVHPVAHVAPTGVKPPVPHRKSSSSSQPIPTPVLGGAVNSITGSPANTFCNRQNRYPLQGLNACPPTTGVVLPFFGGAMYIPIPYYVDSTPQEQGDGQEVASNQPADSNTQDSDQGSAATASSRYRSSSNDINESLSEFVFVQRDGTKFYAVAYSVLNDKLHYVTKEGIRRTAALDSLDWDATQKLNEDLGNTINLPTPPTSGVALSVPSAPLRSFGLLLP